MENKESLGNSKKEPMPVGKWKIDQKKCNGCGECVEACSIGLLYIDKESQLVVLKNENYCNECADCASVCAYRSITFV